MATRGDGVRGRVRRLGPAGSALAAGVILISLAMRPAVSGVPPILEELRSALDLSTTGVSLLTMLPLLCMGVFAPLGPVLRVRLGEERALAVALTVLFAGLAVRAAWPQAALWAGTVVAGGSIAVLNVLVPSLIKRRFPAASVGVLMGLYTVGLAIGPAVAAGMTFPIYQAAGHSVSVALGAWAVPVLVALAAWVPQLRHGPDRAAAAPGGRPVVLARSALAWQVTLYMGLQSVNFFTTLSWLPTLFRDRGVDAASAGFLVALANFVSFVPALAVPVLASRAPSQRRWIVICLALTIAGMLGILLAPIGTVTFWVSLLGLGQGGNIGLALLLIVLRAPDGPTSARLSSMAQTVGYTTSSFGPLVVGMLYAATGGWGLPIALLTAAALVQLAAGLLAGRARVLGAPAPGRADPARTT